MFSEFTRRGFMQTTVTGAATAGAVAPIAGGLGYFFTAPAVHAARAADKPNEKIHFAGIGVGGKGDSDISNAGSVGEVVALCDIDEHTLDRKAGQFKQAKKFFDFREMLTQMGDKIDAVTVSTPDHTHAVASLMAIRMKKHVYCQKPMTHFVGEARLMRTEAKKYGVCTQMGNQGTAETGLRRAVELIQGGIIGQVKEVHVWTNRPIWPQAPSYTARPSYSDPVPKHVKWDLFLGPAEERPFVDKYREGPAKGRNVYHSFAWRGWWAFGTGALGDMACHTANMAFMALKLGYPTSIEAVAGDVNPETCPSFAHVTIQFPAREKMIPVTWNWYEGRKEGKKLLPPEELLAKVLNKGEKPADSGSMLVGEKGILYSPNDYGAAFRITPKALTQNVNLSKLDHLPTNGGGDLGMKKEWVAAIRAGKPHVAMSNFDYSGLLTETVLLGNVAIRVGKKLMWDGEAMACTNCEEAKQFVVGTHRKGWEVYPKVS